MIGQIGVKGTFQFRMIDFFPTPFPCCLPTTTGTFGSSTEIPFLVYHVLEFSSPSPSRALIISFKSSKVWDCTPCSFRSFKRA